MGISPFVLTIFFIQMSGIQMNKNIKREMVYLPNKYFNWNTLSVCNECLFGSKRNMFARSFFRCLIYEKSAWFAIYPASTKIGNTEKLQRWIVDWNVDIVHSKWKCLFVCLAHVLCGSKHIDRNWFFASDSFWHLAKPTGKWET